MLALAWLLSLLFSIPQAFVFRSTVDEETGQEKYTCITDFVEGWGRQVSTYTVKIYRKLKHTIGMITYRNTLL